MCQNIQANVVNLMTAIRPTLVSFLTYEHIDTTTGTGATVLGAFDAAENAVKTWVKGTTAQNVIQIINDFSTIFSGVAGGLGLPPAIVALVDIITAGITAVIDALTANSPAPPQPADSTLSAEDYQAAYEHEMLDKAKENLAARVPGFKRSLFHSPGYQYKSYWNKTVDVQSLPATLKV